MLVLSDDQRSLVEVDEQQFERLRERFFEALDARQLDVCRQTLAEMRNLPLTPAQRPWLDYYLAILLGESAPPRWDQAERLLFDLMDSELEPQLRARLLLELGFNADMQGDCPRAVERYRRSLVLFERLADTLYQGKVLKNLGIAYTRGYELDQFARSALQKALACHEQSLQIFNGLGETWLAAIVWHELGTVHKGFGEWDEALHYYRRRASVCRRLGKRYHLGLTLNNMGEIYQRKRVWNWATRCYRQALAIMREFDDLYEQADVLANLATLRCDQGRMNEAEDIYDQAIGLVESMRAALSTEGARTHFFETEIHVYEGKLQLCLAMKQKQAAFATLERAKSRAFIELLAHHPLRPPQNIPPAWLAQEQDLRGQLHTLYQASDTPPEDATIASTSANELRASLAPGLERELADLRHKIRLRNPEYASFQTVDPIDLATVQEQLPPDALLLEYFVTTATAGVFLISREETQVVPLPVTLSALRRAFNSERPTLIHHLTPDRNGHLHQPWPLAELSRLLIEPIAERLRGRRLLCIIPHGPLHYVPFHALHTDAATGHSPGQDGQPYYLLDQAEVLYAPSATVLLEYCHGKAPSQQSGSLILAYGGGPSAEPTLSPATTNRRDSRCVLRHAEAEGQGVRDILDGKLYAGDQAQRAVIYNEAEQHRFLHFACHARFNSGFPLSSGLVLADGILDVVDILQHVRLDAELVTLSGCETGLSALRKGDELTGLVRAFIYAGTPSVLVSLWPVDDLSTRILMEKFYGELTTGEGTTKSQALRRAQQRLMTLTEREVREQLARYGLDDRAVDRELRRLRRAAGKKSEAAQSQFRPFAHPYYWAPFMLVGDRL